MDLCPFEDRTLQHSERVVGLRPGDDIALCRASQGGSDFEVVVLRHPPLARGRELGRQRSAACRIEQKLDAG